MEEVRTDLVEIMSLVKGNVERELLLRNELLKSRATGTGRHAP